MLHLWYIMTAVNKQQTTLVINVSIPFGQAAGDILLPSG